MCWLETVNQKKAKEEKKMKKILLVMLLLMALASILLAEDMQLQEITLDEFMSDYLPDYKIEKQIQLEGIGRDFAVAKDTGEIVTITEIGNNFKVYYFDKVGNLQWEKDFLGKGYEINCRISENGTAIVITNYISEFATNTVLDNSGNFLFERKLKSIKLKPIPNGQFFYEEIGMMANREKGVYLYDRSGNEIELTGFDFTNEEDIRLEFLNNGQIISYMDTKLVFFKFHEGHFQQIWDYVLSEKQDLDDFFHKSLKYTSEYILIQGMIAKSNSFIFNYEGNLEYEDMSFQSASFINNSNVLLARREVDDVFIKILNLESFDFSKFQYPFNMYQDFSKVSVFDSKYYANIFVSKIVVSAKKIVVFPGMGRVVPEFNIKNIREIILKNYRIIYKIKKSEISILTVIHGSRDLTNKKNITWEIE